MAYNWYTLDLPVCLSFFNRPNQIKARSKRSTPVMATLGETRPLDYRSGGHAAHHSHEPTAEDAQLLRVPEAPDTDTDATLTPPLPSSSPSSSSPSSTASGSMTPHDRVLKGLVAGASNARQQPLQAESVAAAVIEMQAEVASGALESGADAAADVLWRMGNAGTGGSSGAEEADDTVGRAMQAEAQAEATGEGDQLPPAASEKKESGTRDATANDSTMREQKRPPTALERTEASGAPMEPPPPPVTTTTTTKKRKAFAQLSSASARSLFQFTCKTLQSQRLEHEVRARELDEKTTHLATERETWEKKIRSVKRRLRDFGHPVDVLEPNDSTTTNNNTNNSGAGDNGLVSTGTNSTSGADSYLLASTDWNTAASSMVTTAALSGGNATAPTSLVTMRDALGSRANGFSGAGVGGIADSHIPVSIRHLEEQIRDTLKARKRMVLDMMRNLQGVQDKPKPRLG